MMHFNEVLDNANNGKKIVAHCAPVLSSSHTRHAGTFPATNGRGIQGMMQFHEVFDTANDGQSFVVHCPATRFSRYTPVLAFLQPQTVGGSHCLSRRAV